MAGVTWIEVDLGQGQLVLLVPAIVNAQTGYLLVDTGCTTTVLSAVYFTGEGATLTGVDPDGQEVDCRELGAQISVGGTGYHLAVGVMGELPFAHLLQQLGYHNTLGLLGNDWLRATAAVLNFAKKKLTFY